MNEESTPGRKRLNLSVDTLDERLNNWGEEFRNGLRGVVDEVRRLADRHDQQFNDVTMWRGTVELRLLDAASTKTDLANLKLDIAKKEAAAAGQRSLLKSGWTWFLGAIVGASAVLGLLTQLGLIRFA